MIWARAFIQAWLTNSNLRFMAGLSLDSLTDQANHWIRKSVGFDEAYPIVSSEDIKEAGEQILGAMRQSTDIHRATASQRPTYQAIQIVGRPEKLGT